MKDVRLRLSPQAVEFHMGDSNNLVSFGALAARFCGQLVLPDDEDFDQVRALHNGMINTRPALLARCISADDVAAGVAYARAADLEIAVRA
jgi:hypothetical protein